MSTTEAIQEKINALPPEQQERVLRYVEFISAPPEPLSQDVDPYAWLKIAGELNLDGPPDWSRRFEDYLNGDARDTRR